MERAFEILAAEYRPMVLCYLRALVRDGHLAEDLTQETMLSAHGAIDSFDPERCFGAWLRGIARLKALQSNRASARHPMLVDSSVVEGMEEVYSLFDQPSGAWEDRIVVVQRCIGRLNDTMRTVVTAVYSRGQTIRQVAADLGHSFDAVAKRLSRSRRLIRECVEQATKQPTEEREHV